MRTEAVALALQKYVLDLVTDGPKTIQSEVKDVFDADTERIFFVISQAQVLTRTFSRALASLRLAPFWWSTSGPISRRTTHC